MPTKEEILQSNGVYLSGKIDGPTHEAILKSMDDWAEQKSNAAIEVEGENLDDRLMLEQKDTLVKKVMFYREQTEKIREFIHENKIGKPSQGFFDAILEHLQQQKDNIINDAVEFTEWIEKNIYAKGLNGKWYKIPGVLKGEQFQFTTVELYKLFKQPLP